MSTNPAVRRLNQDLRHLHQDQARVKHAQATVKADAAKEKAALHQIDVQRQQVMDAFVNAPATQTPADEIALLKQMFALGQKEVQTKDRFDHVIAGDKHQVSRFQGAVTHDRKQALHDLKPAEYHLSLKETNKDRKELGLKPLHKALRAGPSHVTATMKHLASAARSTALSMGGYHGLGLCATGVSRAIQKVMGFHVWGNGNQIDNNLPKNKFKQIHISLAQALKIPGLVLTWEHTSTALGSKYGHTAITLGDGHSSASDFIENNTLLGNQSRTGLKIFMPTA